MSKKLFIFLFIITLILNTGCVKDTSQKEIPPDDSINNSQENNEIKNEQSLEIIEILVPSGLNTFFNEKKYEDIKLSNIEERKIEITFNQNIKDNNYIFNIMEYDTSYDVIEKNNTKDGTMFSYEVIDNKIIVDLYEGLYFDGIISLYVPKELESVDGTFLSDDKLFMFTSYLRINRNYFEEETGNTYGGGPISSELIKSKDDKKSIYFVNKNISNFFSKEYMDSDAISLNKGQNLIINEINDEYAEAEIYYSKKVSLSRIPDDFEIIEKDDFNIVKGLIDKNDITKLIEPLNEETNYAVKRRYSRNGPNKEVFLCIYPPMYGEVMLPLLNNVAELDESTVHLIESLSIYNLINIVSNEEFMHPGNDFDKKTILAFLKSKNSNNEVISAFDEKIHYPEINWTEEEYIRNINAYNLYIDNIIEVLEDFKVTKGAENFKENVKEIILDRAEIQKIWIDWGHKNKQADKNYMLNEILATIELNENQIKQANNIFKNEENHDLYYILEEFMNIKQKDVENSYIDTIEKAVFDYEIPEQEIIVSPYDKGIKYDTNESANLANGGFVADDADYIYFINTLDDYKLYKISKDGKEKLKISDVSQLSHLMIYNDRLYFTQSYRNEDGEYKNNICSINTDGKDFRVEFDKKFVLKFIIKDDLLYYIAHSDNKSEEGFNIYSLYSYSMNEKVETQIQEGVIDRCLIAFEDTLYYMDYDYVIKYNILTQEIITTDIESNFNYVYLAYVQRYHDKLFARLDDVLSLSLPEGNTWETAAPSYESVIIQMVVTDNYVFYISLDIEEYKNNASFVMNIFRVKHDGSELTKINRVNYNNVIGYNNEENIAVIDDKLILINKKGSIEEKNRFMVFDFDGNELDWDI